MKLFRILCSLLITGIALVEGRAEPAEAGGQGGAEARGLPNERGLYLERRTAFDNPRTDDPALPNVLLIGDSISVGYTAYVRRQLRGKADIYRIPSNARWTGYGLDNLDKWLDQLGVEWDVVHFNWGLWDLCYRNPRSRTQGNRDKLDGKLTTSLEDYRANLQKLVARLAKTGAQLIWCNTTPVPEGEAGRKVGDDLRYNEVAAAVMGENGIAINDLHAHALTALPGIQVAEGDVHFTEDGYIHLAEKVSEAIARALARPTAMPTEGDRPVGEDWPEKRVVRLWPIKRVGGEENRLREEYRHRGGRRQLCRVMDPNITLYPAESAHPTPAVIFSPGGGYGVLSLPSTEQIRAWSDLGITLIVLKYTIPKQLDAALQDIQRAVRTVRHHTGDWNIDPEQIGLFGNSAGGHLSARLANNFNHETYRPIDAIDDESCEPNFVILQSSAYFNGIPVGESDVLDKGNFHLKNPVAPTFLTYAKDDVHFPGGQKYADAAAEAGYPIHLELFEQGGHGMQDCDWFAPATRWLREIGVLDEESHPLP